MPRGFRPRPTRSPLPLQPTRSESAAVVLVRETAAGWASGLMTALSARWMRRSDRVKRQDTAIAERFGVKGPDHSGRCDRRGDAVAV